MFMWIFKKKTLTPVQFAQIVLGSIQMGVEEKWPVLYVRLRALGNDKCVVVSEDEATVAFLFALAAWELHSIQFIFDKSTAARLREALRSEIAGLAPAALKDVDETVARITRCVAEGEHVHQAFILNTIATGGGGIPDPPFIMGLEQAYRQVAADLVVKWFGNRGFECGAMTKENGTIRISEQFVRQVAEFLRSGTGRYRQFSKEVAIAP